MTPTVMTVILALLVVTIAVYFYKKRPVKDIVVPEPSALRTDVLYGYYGRLGNQVEETQGQVTLLWESQFEGREKARENILQAKMFTVLDVGPNMMFKFQEKGRNYRLTPNAEDGLRDMFNFLKSADALKYVKAIYPMDEPNINVLDENELRTAIQIIRKVSAEFEELRDVKMLTIYAAKPETYDCISEFDYVGVDDYDNKSQIFVNGTYDGIKSRMKLGAKTILLPGGAFGQNILPFYNFTHNNLEVGMLLPFVWFGPMQPADQWVGIRDDANPVKQQYVDAGRKMTSLYN